MLFVCVYVYVYMCMCVYKHVYTYEAACWQFKFFTGFELHIFYLHICAFNYWKHIQIYLVWIVIVYILNSFLQIIVSSPSEKTLIQRYATIISLFLAILFCHLVKFWKPSNEKTKDICLYNITSNDNLLLNFILMSLLWKILSIELIDKSIQIEYNLNNYVYFNIDLSIHVNILHTHIGQCAYYHMTSWIIKHFVMIDSHIEHHSYHRIIMAMHTIWWNPVFEKQRVETYRAHALVHLTHYQSIYTTCYISVRIFINSMKGWESLTHSFR